MRPDDAIRRLQRRIERLEADLTNVRSRNRQLEAIILNELDIELEEWHANTREGAATDGETPPLEQTPSPGRDEEEAVDDRRHGTAGL